MLCVLLLAGLLAWLALNPVPAEAGVAGQQEAWSVGFGTQPGELFDPQAIGVDPVDGSVFVLSNSADFTAVRVDEFSASGSFEASVAIPRAPEEAGAEGVKGFVGIAVDHTRKRFYLVQSEKGLETGEPEAPVATRVLVFSTEAEGVQLVPAATPSFGLPAANSPETLLRPNEIHVDPSDGDLVISAEDSSGRAVLQRITAEGVPGNRYEEAGTALRPSSPGGLNFGFDLGSDGTTYLVANTGAGTSGDAAIEAFTLPPGFDSAPSAPTPLAGFTEVAGAEGWETDPAALLLTPTSPGGDGFGPQLALATAPDGEVTLFWKTGTGQSEPEVVQVHGYSLQQRATDAVYGGGAAPRECSIETPTAALAATSGGALVVVDHGQSVAEPSTPPAWGPNVLRFGPSGGGCPGPAPLIRLRTGSVEASSVPAGTTLTLDGGESELGAPLASLTWTIEGPGGTETIPVAGPAPAFQLDHAFSTQGEYTIRLGIETSAAVGHVGTVFVAKPKKLTVTPAIVPAPTVSGVSPSHGPASGGTSVTVTGTHLTGATEVDFGSTAATGVTVLSDTELSATSPPCAAGSSGDVTVTTPGGRSTPDPPGDLFGCDPAIVPAPTVSGVSPSHGPASGGTSVTVTGTHLTGATEVDFGSTAATGVTPVSDTELKATSPPAAPGSKVDVVVVTGGGASAKGSIDRFAYDPGPTTHSLTIVKGGTGSGVVACNGAPCLNSYLAGTLLQLSASPRAGSTFAGWSGACTGTGACGVTLSFDVSITATFDATSGAGETGQDAVLGVPGSGPTAAGSSSAGATGPMPRMAQLLRDKRRKALARCRKKRGAAKTKCVKRAKAIGRPKKSA